MLPSVKSRVMLLVVYILLVNYNKFVFGTSFGGLLLLQRWLFDVFGFLRINGGCIR